MSTKTINFQKQNREVTFVNCPTEQLALPNGALSMREYTYRLGDKLDDLKWKLEREKRRTERIERKNKDMEHYIRVRKTHKEWKDNRGIVSFILFK